MVLVSALNVGVMQVSFEPKIKTNADALQSTPFSYDNLYLNKGDDFGCFEMGSTIVILAQKDMLELTIKAGESVKYGQTIAKIK
jgi:phosphatidylserine decarboxylase